MEGIVVVLTPLEEAVERAATLAELLGGDHVETRLALLAVERERYAEEIRAQYPPIDWAETQAG